MKGKTSKFLQLESELSGYKRVMREAADTIINENVSDYPIFIIHQQEVELGIPIAIKGKVKGNWSVNASTMEEMISKNIIKEEKIDSFKTIYKSPKTHLCCFVLSELGAQFVFINRERKDI